MHPDRIPSSRRDTGSSSSTASRRRSRCRGPCRRSPPVSASAAGWRPRRSTTSCRAYRSRRRRQIPASGSTLFNYLLRRQLDSLGAPTFGMVPKFLSWTNRPDTTSPLGSHSSPRPPHRTLARPYADRRAPGAHRAGVPGDGGEPFCRAPGGPRADLRRAWGGEHMAQPPSAGVRDSQGESTVTNIRIYDPNDPGDDGVVIRCELLAGGSRVRCVQVWSRTVRRRRFEDFSACRTHA